MEIRVDDLQGEAIARFLAEHIEDMRATSPPESKHALDLEGLRQPEITFWCVYLHEELVGCGALKQLDAQTGEIKSMRTHRQARGSGVASALLHHIVQQARSRQYTSLYLETGSMPFFEPARRLYMKHGFQYCKPFANYREDPNSVFMNLTL